MQNASRIGVIDLGGFLEFIHTIKNQIGPTAMAKIAIPPDLAACLQLARAPTNRRHERATLRTLP